MGKPFLFTGPNCPACDNLKKALKEAGFSLEKDIVVVEAMKNMQMARLYNVRGFPTTIFFGEDGKEVKRFVGQAEVFKVVERMKED